MARQKEWRLYFQHVIVTAYIVENDGVFEVTFSNDKIKPMRLKAISRELIYNHAKRYIDV